MRLNLLNALMGTSATSMGLKIGYADLGAAGFILGQLMEKTENPFEYSPEEEIRRGLRRAPEMA